MYPKCPHGYRSEIAMIVCDECIKGSRRRKKFPNSGTSERRSPKREPSGTRFCEHGVPGTKDCVVVGCWNNSETPETGPIGQPRQLPLLGLIPLREVLDAAADDIERKGRKPKKREKPKPEPPPLTGRAPRAHDGEEV